MTQEWMIKTLINLGLGQRDAEVYAFLTLNGTQNASVVAEALKTYERQVNRILRDLQNRKIITESQEQPAQFSALPFDKLLDLIAKTSLQEAKLIEQNKNNLLALWNSCVKKEASA